MLSAIRYHFRIYFRNKENFIWNLIFPFAFILIYTMAMHSFNDKKLELPVVNVAIVEQQTTSNETSQTSDFFTFDDFLGHVSAEEAIVTDEGFVAPDGAKPLILYKKTDAETALEWLKKGTTYATVFTGSDITSFEAVDKIAGYDNSMILNAVLNAYEQSRANVDNIALAVQEGRIAPSDIPDIVKLLEFDKTKKIDVSTREQSLSSSNIYYYAMIAYIAFFPVNAGITAVQKVEANHSSYGLRTTISPRSKRRRFFASFMPVFFVTMVTMVLFFFFLRFLTVGLDSHLGLTLLIMLATSLSSILTGTAIGSIFGTKPGFSMAVSIALPLVLGFTSGMMFHTIRNKIQAAAPWVHKINPIGNASNALAFLNGSGGLERFWPCLYAILIYSAVMISITLIGMRRNSYDSL